MVSDLPTAEELRAAVRDKVSQTQSDLTAAKAENEALRGRVSDLEVALDCQLQAFEQSEAEILRKQAEAVEEAIRLYIPAGLARTGVENYAQRLRRQADELERNQ